MESRLKEYSKRIIFILFGSLISAVGINVFIVPHKLISGGVSGIALILQYLFNFPAGYTIILMNIPLFIWSLREVDKEFTALSILGTIALSVFLVVTKDIVHTVLVKDIFLSCIYGGVLIGAGLGIIFSNHASTGGTDIISVIVKRKRNIDVGKISFMINLVVVGIGAALFSIETGLYTIVTIYVTGIIIDKVLKGFGQRKLLLIVSDKEELIIEKIKIELERGATVLYGEGSYTREKKGVIYCVVSLRELPRIKKFINEIDTNAFTSIIDTSEVHGKGFKAII